MKNKQMRQKLKNFLNLLERHKMAALGTKKRNGTATSSFGTPGRSNHDSTKFYNSKMYNDLNTKNGIVEYRENAINKNNLNKIFCKSSEKMSELPDDSVHIMITSPPYNVGKDYDKDLSLE